MVDVVKTQNSTDSIAVRTGNVDKIEQMNAFYSIDQAKVRVKEIIEAQSYTGEVSGALIEYTTHFIYANWLYSDKETQEEVKHAQENVSRYFGYC